MGKVKNKAISPPATIDPIGNIFEVVPDNSIKGNVNGTAIQCESVLVTESRSKTETTVHEQLHCLGIDHHTRGIMTESQKDPRRSNKLDKRGVLDDIKKLLDNPNNAEKMKIIIMEDLEFKINNLKLNKK